MPVIRKIGGNYRAYRNGEYIGGGRRREEAELQEMRESDPEAYFKHIEEVRQRSYRLAGRNPDGSRK